MIVAMHRIPLDFTLWIYRKLICLYPHEFRERFEEETIQLVRTELRQRGPGESWNVFAALWKRWIPDLIAGALRERYAQLEERMRNSMFVSNGVAFAILFAWFAFVGLSEAKYFLHIPIKDPTQWLLGESFTSLALVSLNSFLALGPIAALVLACRPFFQVGHGSRPGYLLEIRIQRAAGASLALILGSGLASMLILAVFTLARIY
jgi:hypothetical protein